MANSSVDWRLAVTVAIITPLLSGLFAFGSTYLTNKAQLERENVNYGAQRAIKLLDRKREIAEDVAVIMYLAKESAKGERDKAALLHNIIQDQSYSDKLSRKRKLIGERVKQVNQTFDTLKTYKRLALFSLYFPGIKSDFPSLINNLSFSLELHGKSYDSCRVALNKLIRQKDPPSDKQFESYLKLLDDEEHKFTDVTHKCDSVLIIYEEQINMARAYLFNN